MLKTVNWNGKELHSMSWIENGKVEWMFFGREVIESLGYDLKNVPYTKYISRYCSDDEILKLKAKELKELLKYDDDTSVDIGRKGEWLISETGVYSLIFGSNMPEAIEFKRWVKQTIKSLRKRV